MTTQEPIASPPPMTTNAPSPSERAGTRHRIELYPTFGRLRLADGRWRILVRGRLFQPRADDLRRRLVTRLMRRVLTVPAEQLRTPIFQHRIQGFLVKPQRGERVQVRIDDAHAFSRITQRGGRFSGAFELSPVALDRLLPTRGDREIAPWLRYEARVLGPEGECFEGESQLIGPHGASIISDIDDTIKQTDVRLRRKMLANTFLHPFAAIDGMAEMYQQWQQQGAVFHYVSASPWQLYQPLSEFAFAHGFPRGTYHLRSIKFRNSSMLQLLLGGRRSKMKSILAIMKSYPYRRFVLIGDAGEMDPEIYGAVTRRRKSQVAAICIREIPGCHFTETRAQRAFRNIPPQIYHVFRDAQALKNVAIPTT